jgi:diguanylate cyclase (GGDEF)-like protein
MLDDARRWYCQGLTLQIEALDGALQALRTGFRDAAFTLRRIARGLRDSGPSFGLADVAEVAGEVVEAPESGLARAAGRLIETLRTTTALADGPAVGVLLVGVTDDVAGAVASRLRGPHREVIRAAGAAEAQRALEARDVGLVILDLGLPATDARDLLLELRRWPGTAGVPIFVVGDVGDGLARLECFALGADAFFRRPPDVAALSAAAVGALRRFGEIRAEPRRDAVTQLLNRTAFAETYGHHASLSARNRSALTVALIGLERSTGGIEGADAAARQFARVLSGSLREADVLGRWGGDDYAVLFPGTGVRGATVALRKALEALGAANRALGFCAGVVAVAHGSPLPDVIAEADRLLYLARSGSGERIVSSEDAPPRPVRLIVLAEDDQVTANVIQHRLAREGFQVRHFLSSSDLLANATELAGAALFILDVKLPGLDGFQLLQRLRGRTEFVEVPVLMLTSLGSEHDIVRAFQLGANDYMTKPFSSAELRARIHRLVEGARHPGR